MTQETISIPVNENNLSKIIENTPPTIPPPTTKTSSIFPVFIIPLKDAIN